MRRNLILVIGIGILLFSIFAHTEKVEAESADYTVQAKIPENQIDKKKSYFDLKIPAGTKQTISMYLTNTSDQEITLTVKTNTAITNKNGIIDYSVQKKDQVIDSSLQVNFSDLIKGTEEVVLKPKETKEVFYEITMPKEKTVGLILGGFHISKKDSKEKEDTKGSMIENKISYVIAVALTQEKSEIKSELKMNEVKPNLENYRTVVTANLQNTQPEILSNFEVTAKIMKKGSNKVIHETTKKMMTMAPNSNFDFPISWDNQPLKAGDYTIDLTASTDDDKWHFTDNFKIKAEESKELNKKAVELKEDNSWLVWIIVGLTLAVIVLIILLIWNKKKQMK